MPRKSWYTFTNKAPENTTIMMYGEIGKGGVRAIDFLQELSAISASKINIRVHSPGGNVFDGMVIYEGLKESKADINFQVDGVAASIASTICMAGKVTMAKSAMMMIHQPFSMSGGNIDELQSSIDALSQISANMVDAYNAKTGIKPDQIKEMMKAETWLNAEKCKAMGFCDCIGTQSAIKAAFDFAGLHNVPDEVKSYFNEKEFNPENERDLEQVLRDAGLSKKDALTAVSSIKSEALRDSEALEAEKMRNYREFEACRMLLQY